VINVLVGQLNAAGNRARVVTATGRKRTYANNAQNRTTLDEHSNAATGARASAPNSAPGNTATTFPRTITTTHDKVSNPSACNSTEVNADGANGTASPVTDTA
jgi:hypothetical protein